MSTSVTWNSSGSRVLALPTQGKWKEVRGGLRLVVTGWILLFTFVALGASLRPPLQGWLPLSGLTSSEREDLAALGLLVGAAGVVLGSLFGLVGQWLCLRSAPLDGGGKELVFTSILAALVAVPLACAAPFREELWDGRALEDLLGALQHRTVPPVVSVLAAAFFCLVLVNLLAFSQFVRILAVRFESRLLGQGVGAFFLYVCVLMGSTVGTVGSLGQFSVEALLLTGVAVGWALCLPWHALLVIGALRGVGRATAQKTEQGQRRDGGTKKPYSGLHRVVKSPWADLV